MKWLMKCHNEYAFVWSSKWSYWSEQLFATKAITFVNNYNLQQVCRLFHTPSRPAFSVDAHTLKKQGWLSLHPSALRILDNLNR